mmetsp:Transcript_12650/g.30774  ORF Transcript_12650/g.30774 Transcript_12650/m.30774 type:complete len:251 (-) Transcript_12650:362-1114(-)
MRLQIRVSSFRFPHHIIQCLLFSQFVSLFFVRLPFFLPFRRRHFFHRLLSRHLRPLFVLFVDVVLDEVHDAAADQPWKLQVQLVRTPRDHSDVAQVGSPLPVHPVVVPVKADHRHSVQVHSLEKRDVRLRDQVLPENAHQRGLRPRRRVVVDGHLVVNQRVELVLGRGRREPVPDPLPEKVIAPAAEVLQILHHAHTAVGLSDVEYRLDDALAEVLFVLLRLPRFGEPEKGREQHETGDAVLDAVRERSA